MAFKFATSVAATAIVASLSLSPAFAAGNGNGGSNGGGNGSSHENSSSHSDKGKSTATHGKSNSASAKSTATAKDSAEYGKLNGFLHASPKALANAAPNSAIGLVMKGYEPALAAYLQNPNGTASLGDLKLALEKASNKPLTASTIEAVDKKLASLDPALSSQIKAYPGGATALAQDIAAAK